MQRVLKTFFFLLAWSSRSASLTEMEAINQDHNLNRGEKEHGSSSVDRHQILFLSENCEKLEIRPGSCNVLFPMGEIK